MGKVEFPAKVVVVEEEGKKPYVQLQIGGIGVYTFDDLHYDINLDRSKSSIILRDLKKETDYNKGFVDGYKKGIEAGREILADQVRKALEKRVIHIEKVGDEE